MSHMIELGSRRPASQAALRYPLPESPWLVELRPRAPAPSKTRKPAVQSSGYVLDVRVDRSGVQNRCIVAAVSRAAEHTFSKHNEDSIRLLAGLGVEGDAHLGRAVQHRSRVARDPSQPNLRQVHLIHGELHDELRARGFDIEPGVMGENITTRGVDLLALPTGAWLRLGEEAVVEVTGLRNPCLQLDRLQQGLMAAVLDRDKEGNLVRKAGVMAVVQTSGDVRPGDGIAVELPPAPHSPLGLV